MKTILVVDDDEAIRTLLQEELEEEGYKVLIATNARDALKMVAAEPLDLVILDIRMPGINGVETVRGIHDILKTKQHEKTPVIFITGPQVFIEKMLPVLGKIADKEKIKFELK